MATEFFEQSTERLLDVLDTVPAGRLTTYGALGAAIGVSPRYAASIMAKAPEVSTAPWHRVVGSDAKLRSFGHGSKQKELLQNEGIVFREGKILNFNALLFRL